MSELYLYTPKQYWVLNIESIEKNRNCKYVGDFAIKDRNGNWGEEPCSIFWQETPPVEGYSHYFAVFKRHSDGQAYITSGESIENLVMIGAVAENGEVIYSRFRHDCVYSSDGTAMIDGGRDYTKMTLCSPTVIIRLVGPDLLIDDIEYVEQTPNPLAS
jgi:hypothetical protein